MFEYLKKFAVLPILIVVIGCADQPPSSSGAGNSGEPDDQEPSGFKPAYQEPIRSESNSQGSTAEDIAKVAREYKTLTLMTPEPVFVNPELATLCVGASKQMVDLAREIHGPHANCSVSIYMNESAAAAFNKQGAYPEGAIVVKEKSMGGYRTEGEPGWVAGGDGVGGMIKRKAGYDPEHGDWEYFYFEKADSIESGRMKSCVDCHAKAEATDYVYGSWNNDNDLEITLDENGY